MSQSDVYRATARAGIVALFRQPMHADDIRRIPLASTHRALTIARLDEVVNTLLRKHMIATLARNDTILPLCRLNRTLQTRLKRPKLLLQQLVSCRKYVRVHSHAQSTNSWASNQGRPGRSCARACARARMCGHEASLTTRVSAGPFAKVFVLPCQARHVTVSRATTSEHEYRWSTMQCQHLSKQRKGRGRGRHCTGFLRF